MSPKGTITLIASCAVPLVGLFFFGWSPFETVFAFLIESILISLLVEYELVHVMFADRRSVGDSILFFLLVCVHLVIFGALNLMFAVLLFAFKEHSSTWAEFFGLIQRALIVTIPSTVMICIGQLSGFIRTKRYSVNRFALAKKDALIVFSRSFTLQAVIVVGSFIMNATENAALAVSVLVVIQFIVGFRRLKKAEVSAQ